MRGGKLAAEVVAERAAEVAYSNCLKDIQASVLREKASTSVLRDPTVINGVGATALGCLVMHHKPPSVLYYSSIC